MMSPADRTDLPQLTFDADLDKGFDFTQSSQIDRIEKAKARQAGSIAQNKALLNLIEKLNFIAGLLSESDDSLESNF